MSEIFLYSTGEKTQTKLNVWCAFPAIYNFGMSSLGYLTVFKYIDCIKNVFAERIFTDTEKTLLRSSEVDLLSFSFSFELDYLGILSILEKYNIPFLSQDRNENHPIIYAGGPVVSANPEPFAQFFDFIMVGDAEPTIKKIMDILIEHKDETKKEKLKRLKEIDGIYIPSMPNTVKKISAEPKESTYTPILTENSFFPNTFIVEVERGCPQNCAFCLTSFINNPVRYFPYEDIIDKIELGLKYTNKIALLGALTCAHPRIDDISQYIIDKIKSGMKIEVSISSLRADYVSDKTLEMLHLAGQRTGTIAIEAGTERLRNVINKRLSDNNILDLADKMVKHGFSGLKIYGILGLPTETKEDLDAFVSLCKKIKEKHKGFTLIPSFSTFVPKAQTPFQYAKREDTKTLEKKNEYIKKEFAKIGIKARTGSAKWDYIQALLSRGTSDLTPYLIDVYKNGGSVGSFKNVYKEYVKSKKLPPSDEIALNEFAENKNPAWDFIKYPKTQDTLNFEYKRLLNI
ncbi:radical SAM protein [bacterium]|nr:radical SAM protein [bacterium]